VRYVWFPRSSAARSDRPPARTTVPRGIPGDRHERPVVRRSVPVRHPVGGWFPLRGNDHRRLTRAADRWSIDDRGIHDAADGPERRPLADRTRLVTVGTRRSESGNVTVDPTVSRPDSRPVGTVATVARRGAGRRRRRRPTRRQTAGYRSEPGLSGSVRRPYRPPAANNSFIANGGPLVGFTVATSGRPVPGTSGDPTPTPSTPTSDRVASPELWYETSTPATKASE